MKNEYIDGLNRITNYDDRSHLIRLDMNENPSGLPNDFCLSIIQKITPEFLSTYPNCFNFIDLYSKYLGLDFENILPTNGSDMAIRLIFDSFVNPGSEVVGVSPSFEMYRIYSEMHGAKYVGIRYENDLSFNVDLLVSSIDDHTSLVILLNPNNPVGNVFSRSDVYRIIKQAKSHNSMVLIDEAYYYYNDSSLIDLIHEYDNVVILRTFSKLLSIAALRLGAIISNKDLIKTIFKAQPSFDVNSVALLFGEEIIQSPDVINNLTSQFKECKSFAEKWLIDNDYSFVKTHTNFVLIKPKKSAPENLKSLFFEHKYLIKTYNDPLLKEYFRINMAAKDVLSDFFNLLQQFDK
ncbi:MAG: histidinol-phosphate aminotransferase family protein [Candidatus Methanomethylophilaceae archaeon]|nr:histidinol-phosphate aminotransferase family protein [Candidatus Methanomethylophilaceae archaeon]